MHLVKVLAGVAHQNLQTSYAGLQKSLHQEWSIVQHVTLHIVGAFHPVEEAL